MLINLASIALLASTAAAAAALPPSKPPKGFVTASGTKFKLDGKDFYFAGSNAYVSTLAHNQPKINITQADKV
jgi:mannan endo-1,4-beta-mannosidase